MSLWSKLFGGRGDRARRAEDLLAAIERIAEGAASLREVRERIAKGAMQGDLDDVVSWAHGRDARVRDFIKGR